MEEHCGKCKGPKAERRAKWVRKWKAIVWLVLTNKQVGESRMDLGWRAGRGPKHARPMLWVTGRTLSDSLRQQEAAEGFPAAGEGICPWGWWITVGTKLEAERLLRKLWLWCWQEQRGQKSRFKLYSESRTDGTCWCIQHEKWGKEGWANGSIIY